MHPNTHHLCLSVIKKNKKSKSVFIGAVTAMGIFGILKPVFRKADLGLLYFPRPEGPKEHRVGCSPIQK